MTTWQTCLEHNTRYSQTRGCAQCKNKESIVALLEDREVKLANGETRMVKKGNIKLTICGEERVFRMNSYETIYLEAFLKNSREVER